MFNTVKNSVKYEIKKYGEKKKIKDNGHIYDIH